MKINLIKKSIAASLLISLGNYVLLKIGNPLGPFLFSFGLLGVCYLNLNLFTGKCGFILENKIKVIDILIILIVNLIFGYLFGYLYSYVDKSLVQSALLKVSTYEFSFSFFVKSFMCGVIMYLAVKMYKEKTALGIIFGVPLFIFSGFQHSIANIITLGVASTFDWSIILCILGNFIGSLFVWYISTDYKIEKRVKKC